MIHSLYHEIVKLIMKNLNRRVRYSSSSSSRSSSQILPRTPEISNPSPIKTDPSSLFSQFDGFDYHLNYDSEDNFISWTSHNGKVFYSLGYDSFDDLIKVNVSSKDFSFFIGLIYENYDLRENDSETEEKGNLTDVVLLDATGNSLIKGFRIDPSYQEVDIGESAQYRAYATLINDTEIDVTDVVLWKIPSPLKIQDGLVTDTVSGTYTITANYMNSAVATATLRVRDIQLFLRPETITIDQGDTAKFDLYRKYNNELNLINPLDVEWIIDREASISEYGVVSNTRTMEGTYKITASYKNNEATGTLIVKAPQLVIVPEEQECQVGELARFSAVVKRVKGDTDVTDLAIWYAQDPMIISHGDATTDNGQIGAIYWIKADYSFDTYNLSANGSLKLIDDKLEIVPKTQEIFVGETAVFRAYYTSRGIKSDITADVQAIWAINSPCVINRGIVTNTDVIGNYPVTVQYNGKIAEATLVIKHPTLRIVPSTKTIKMGETFNFQAIYNQSGKDINVTNNLLTEWEIDLAPLVIDKGKVSNTVVTGTATITARYNGYTANATLIIDDINLIISPENATIYKGETYKFRAFLDGVDVTDLCTWNVNLPPLTINKGFVSNTNTIGTAKITASYAGKTAEAYLQILDSQLIITPSEKTIELGEISSFKFTSELVKGASRQDVTNVAQWSNSPLSPVFLNKGLATNLTAPGVYTITAKYDGKTATAILRIVEKVLTVDNVNVKLQFIDDEDEDGDSIAVFLNGQMIVPRLDITNSWQTINVTLKEGTNILRVGALYNGRFMNYKGEDVTAAVRVLDADGNILYDKVQLHIQAPTTGKLTTEKGPLDPNVYYKEWSFEVS